VTQPRFGGAFLFLENNMSTIKLVPPEGTTSASVGGVQYDADKNGHITVPAEHAIQLYSFGFGNAPEEPEKKPAKQKPAEA
jgi:hypothetical protein